MGFIHVTELAHELVGPRLRPGDVAVDATVGNGYDTLFLAKRVRVEGRVIGFDIQPEAIESTRNRLAEAKVLERVDLRVAGHETIEELEGPFRAVMFNLGYLPGGDKAKVTRAVTTIAALRSCVEKIMPGGLLTIVVYPGHEGGGEEAKEVLDFCEELDPENFSSVRHLSSNQSNNPPFLIAIERRLAQPC